MDDFCHQIFDTYYSCTGAVKPDNEAKFDHRYMRLTLFPGSSAPEQEIELVRVERAWYFFSHENPQK